jgi:hypothetical protein
MARISKAAENAAARDLVNELHAGGMSYKEIGRRVGRDSSLISQIARGRPKGASLADALAKVQAGETSIEVPRRQTKAGTEAKVRRGVGTIPGTDNITVDTKTGNKTILNGLGQVSGKGKYVKWRLKMSWVKTISDRRYTNTGIDGHLPQGWTTDTLQDRINNPQAGDNWNAGDARGALKEIALSQNQGAFTSAGRVLDVHLYSMD